MSEMIIRVFEPDLEIKPRAKGGDGRTLYGIAVPWRRPVEIPSERIREQFAPGAFDAQERAADRIRTWREHQKLGGQLIGRLELMRNDTAGQYVEARVARTDAGEETLALVEDGVLNEWSVGFKPGQNRQLPGGVLERVTAHMSELAVTMAGAYGDGAAIAGVRSAEEPHPNLDRARQLTAGLPTLPAAV